jgi:hypothetical protein
METLSQKRELDRETQNKVVFMTCIVPAFADAYKMNVQDAFFYLKKYGAWDFLNEHWWALHNAENWTKRKSRFKHNGFVTEEVDT